MPHIIFQQDKAVDEADASLPLLQIARNHGIPHVAACGGHARCSTCRVLVVDGLENLTTRTEPEARLARLKGFEPNIRLACQTRALGPATVRRLVWDDQDIELALAGSAGSSGREATLAILFSDIRSFTPFAEHNLAYDVVHVLNRYFREMGAAVQRHGGYIDKYIGDGMMAVFGLDVDDPGQACGQAVLAALDMLQELPNLNRYFTGHFNAAFSIGIGIHVGSVIVAEIGHPRRMQFTAIGDTVNVASRVESATKEIGAQLLVTTDVADQLGRDFSFGRRTRVHLKGTTGERELIEVVAALAPALTVDSAARSRSLRRELEQRMTLVNAPLFLRLAFHDAISYNPQEETGGADGSICFPEELARQENQGLDKAAAIILNYLRESPGVSRADLIALAGAAAVRKCGGPDIDVPLGRADAKVADPIARVPDEDAEVPAQKEYFAARGFTTREYVALMGGHTIGKARGVPFTDDLYVFSNSYYHKLLAPVPNVQQTLLKSDRILLDDQQTRALVVEYAMDENAFFRDFASGYVKLSLLGTDIDQPNG